jgi:hypothetical protein
MPTSHINGNRYDNRVANLQWIQPVAIVTSVKSVAVEVKA